MWRKRWLMYCHDCEYVEEGYFGQMICIKEVINRATDAGWLYSDRNKDGLHSSLCPDCATRWGSITAWQNDGIDQAE